MSSLSEGPQGTLGKAVYERKNGGKVMSTKITYVFSEAFQTRFCNRYLYHQSFPEKWQSVISNLLRQLSHVKYDEDSRFFLQLALEIPCTIRRLILIKLNMQYAFAFQSWEIILNTNFDKFRGS